MKQIFTIIRWMFSITFILDGLILTFYSGKPVHIFMLLLGLIINPKFKSLLSILKDITKLSEYQKNNEENLNNKREIIELREQISQILVENNSIKLAHKQMSEANREFSKENISLKEENQRLFNANQKITDEYNKLNLVHQYTTGEKESLLQEINDNQDKLHSLQLKTKSVKLAFDSMKKAIKENFNEEDISVIEDVENNLILKDIEIPLNCLNIRELRTLFNRNRKNIQDVLVKYEKRYTTKTNTSIYQLMVIGLEADFQNILLTIKFNKLEQSIEKLKDLIFRYYNIACNTNQSIAPTMKKFLIEMESLYIESVKIEYEYYVQKERIKEEQKALREQMKQEAEERKQLEAEQKKIAKEESKYNNEIENINQIISNTSDSSKLAELQEQLEKLKSQLDNVKTKKNDIVKLQNGQAGYVYVISNLGSFGNDVFKVGMTRRLEPMDRINELSNASVPFSFDVHSFIFSDNAVDLERKLHKELNDYRVNKVNLRKEFFKISIDEIEQLVQRINPAAEFNRTMLAEQYKQGLSVDTIPESFSETLEDEEYV